MMRFAWRRLRRELKSGEIKLIAFALAIAIAALSAVGFFVDRARLGLEQQAAELLAADLTLSSRAPIGAEFAAAARREGLATATTASLLSVVVAGERIQLTDIKAVSAGYPLRGQLRVANAAYGADTVARGVPGPHEVWIDPRLAQALGVAVGGDIGIGARRFKVARILSYEPDRGGDFFSLAPRALIHTDALAATQLVQPGSRVQYRLLVAGEPGALARYRTWASGHLPAGTRVEGVREARPEMRLALERAEQFLGLAAMVSLVLAGIAIALAARRYTLRQQDTAALLRCFGASSRFVLRTYLAQLLMLGGIASALGVALGYGAQALLARLASGLLQTELPPPSWWPAAYGLLAGIVLLLGFAALPFAGLRRVPPLRVLRRDIALLPPSTAAMAFAALGMMAVLLWWQTRDARLASFVLGGLVAALVLLGAGAQLLLRALARSRGRLKLGAMSLALAGIGRRRTHSMLQVVAFGIALTVLLLLSLVRADLLEQWQGSLPPEAPNRFVINIQPDQLAGVRDFFSTHALGAPMLYPMVRGRFVEHNARAVQRYDDERAQRLASREFNLSYIEALPAHNRIVAGSWPADGWSVEQGLADTLGLKLGDELAFRVADTLVRARITSLRELEWDSFEVNFFVLASPALLQKFPASYVTSFYLPPERHTIVPALIERFPNLTVIDVDAVMQKVREVMQRVAAAVQYVFSFTLAASLMVLFAAVQAGREERLKEAALARALGATGAQLRRLLIIEFTLLGTLAGIIAAAVAEATGFVLAREVFNFTYAPNPLLWLAAVLGGAAGVGAAGLLATRQVLRHPPLAVLRET